LTEFVGESSTQLGITRRRAVPGDALKKSFPCSLNNEIWSIEIRLSSTKAADIPAFVLKRLGFGADLKGQRGLEGYGPMGEFWGAQDLQRTSPGRV
jgi:hypothetical protein